MGAVQELLSTADQRHGIVTTVDAEKLGISADRFRHLVSTGFLVRLHRGVYRTASGSTSLSQRALAAASPVGSVPSCPTMLRRGSGGSALNRIGST